MGTDKELVEVFAGTTWHAGMLKSMLEDSGIEAFIVDEVIGTLNPWWTAAGGLGSVKVAVPAEDYDSAKLIVEDFKKNLVSPE